jgi:hypothetical protein
MTEERQLHLFRGRRQRGRKAPPPKEFLVHCAIADTLRRWIEPGWIWFHVPGGEERPARIGPDGKRFSPAGERLRRMGLRPGVSDFVLIAPPLGRVHALELKRHGKQPTEAQLAFGGELTAAGGVFAWTDTYAGAITTLQSWGALPATIKVQ